MPLSFLRQIDFDLAYLGLLTQAGLKPLSRWEKVLGERDMDAIEKLGLHTGFVQRKLLNGETTTEFIFSRFETNIDMYLSHFEGKPIDKSVNTQHLEGFLFGFPPCCVENFAHYGYRPNRLDAADQGILFHWSCPDCQITPLLLPEYRRIHRLCEDIFAGKMVEMENEQKQVNKWLKQGVALAASVALVAAGVGFYLPDKAAASPLNDDDPHWRPLPDFDLDGDYLYDHEESRLGMSPDMPDTDGDGRLDGVQLAQELHAIYKTLPHEEYADQPFVIDHKMWGLEQCAVCGDTVNMGYAEIVNPLENLSIEVPYIALHYMQHGSFFYSGDVHHSVRINPGVLKVVLESDGTAHRLEIYNDADKDGLPDQDEPFLGTDPENADSDGDGLVDGVQLARLLAAKIDSLPRHECKDSVYVVEHYAKGVEDCQVCGLSINMGYFEIINPKEKLKIDVPVIAHHYMQCGGFRYEGDFNIGMVNMSLLKTVLEADGSEHHLPIYGDADNDGLQDDVEARFDCKVDNPDTDGNGVPDGVQLSQKLWREIEALPRYVQDNQPYRLEFEMDGTDICAVCGTVVNMGFMEIHNPPEDFVVAIPYLALHYMEHGSFAYDGDYHSTRLIDPRKPDCALHSDGTMHILPIDNDSDNDGLNDVEESHFDTDPRNPDSDSDGVVDGAELAKAYAAAIDSLPCEAGDNGLWVKHCGNRGVESCGICGKWENMGWLELINPKLDSTMQIPYIAHHYMHHGSFAYDGSVNGKGRIDPIELATLFGETPTAIESPDVQKPDGFVLQQNYPNPFSANGKVMAKNPGTSIRYQIGGNEPVHVELKVFNLLGQPVRVLIDEELAAGQHQVIWDGRDAWGASLPAGVYLYRMRAGGFVQAKKVILTK